MTLAITLPREWGIQAVFSGQAVANRKLARSGGDPLAAKAVRQRLHAALERAIAVNLRNDNPCVLHDIQLNY